jgi:catechol 2,3-dioxygenase-like lactoylglutathione lyase family enzyme
MPSPALVPELYVSEIGRSLHFYTGVLGFAVLYDRPEEASPIWSATGRR